uniref:Uncharacterized protein n=1 Tax=Mola mola TaxID=94237 RepID=A0A3Q4BIP1_MOLML
MKLKREASANLFSPIFNSSILNDGYCLHRNQQAEIRSMCVEVVAFSCPAVVSLIWHIHPDRINLQFVVQAHINIV